VKLETAGSIRFKSVTEEQLRTAFHEDAPCGEFLILRQQPQVFMQAGGEDDGPYCLEYRDGDDEHHFRAAGEYHRDEVQKAFLWYLAGDPRWRTEFTWQKLNIERKPWWKIW